MTLRGALDELGPVERRAEQHGIWTVNGEQAITGRVLEFLDDAEDEIVYMTVEDLLSDDVIEGLQEAAERDVSIQLAGISEEVQERIQDDIGGARMFDSLWVWSETPAGRLMMVDGRKMLVSVRVNGEHARPADPREETAIWGEGESNSLVVILKAIFTWQLDVWDPD